MLLVLVPVLLVSWLDDDVAVLVTGHQMIMVVMLVCPSSMTPLGFCFSFGKGAFVFVVRAMPFFLLYILKELFLLGMMTRLGKSFFLILGVCSMMFGLPMTTASLPFPL